MAMSSMVLFAGFPADDHGERRHQEPHQHERHRQDKQQKKGMHGLLSFVTSETAELLLLLRSCMPFKSQAQRRKFAELLVEGKISPKTFEEWNRETGGRKLPERVKKKKTATARKRR